MKNLLITLMMTCTTYVHAFNNCSLTKKNLDETFSTKMHFVSTGGALQNCSDYFCKRIENNEISALLTISEDKKTASLEMTIHEHNLKTVVISRARNVGEIHTVVEFAGVRYYLGCQRY